MAPKKSSTKPKNRSKKTAASQGFISVVGRTKAQKNKSDDVFLDRSGLFNNEIIKISDYMGEGKIKTSSLRGNLSDFLKQLGTIVADAPAKFGPFELHEIEISAELSLSGEFKLIGIGGTEVETKGGLKFKIRRSRTTTSD